MQYLAPPDGLLVVDDHPPHILTLSFTRGGLTPVGLAAATTQIATNYLTAAKRAAILNEWTRYAGPPYLPAAQLGTSTIAYPILAADIAAQVALLQTLVATAGNAG